MPRRILITLSLLLTLCTLPSWGQSSLTAQQVAAIKKNAEAGDLNAQIELTNYYMRIKDYENSVYWVEKAATQGAFESQVLLAFCYDAGFGVDTNRSSAKYWLRKALDNNSRDDSFFNISKKVRNALGSLMVRIALDCENNNESSEAAYWMHNAAKIGYPVGQFFIAAAYLEGESYSCQQDLALADYWYRKAFEDESIEDLLLGNENAMDRKTVRLELWNICKSLSLIWSAVGDSEKAAYWLEKAEEFNDSAEKSSSSSTTPSSSSSATKSASTSASNSSTPNPRGVVINSPKSESTAKSSSSTTSSKAASTAQTTTQKSSATSASSAASSSYGSSSSSSYNSYSYNSSSYSRGSELSEWWNDRHGIDNTVYGEFLVGYAFSDNQDATLGVNLGFFGEEEYGRLGLHASLSMMGGPDSWGFRAGPLLRLNDHSYDVEWQLYAGVGPHWDTVDHKAPEGLVTTCHFAWEAGVRANFMELTDDWIISLSSVSLGLQFVMNEVVPTLGLSLWPALLFDDDFDLDFDLDLDFGSNYYTFVGECMAAFGDGALMGASVAWMPSKLGWYASALGAIEAEGNSFTTGPVWSMNEGALSFYTGLGNVAGDFGVDLGIRGIGNFSLSLGLQSNFDATFITFGCGFAL